MATSEADRIVQRLQEVIHQEVKDQPNETYRAVLESILDHCESSLACLDQEEEEEEEAPEGYHDEPEPRPFVKDGLLHD